MDVASIAVIGTILVIAAVVISVMLAEPYAGPVLD
jgi:hypothetical protein